MTEQEELGEIELEIWRSPAVAAREILALRKRVAELERLLSENDAK